MSCVAVHRHGSDLVLLLLWCRLVAITLIPPPPWEPPDAMGGPLKKKKKKKGKKGIEVRVQRSERCEVAEVSHRP